MLAIPPCGASSNIALWRAKIKPPVELVVGDLDVIKAEKGKAQSRRKRRCGQEILWKRKISAIMGAEHLTMERGTGSL